MSKSCRLYHSLHYPAPVISVSKPPAQNHLSYLHSHYPFDESPQRNIRTLNSLLASYFRNEDPLALWALFQQIHSTRTDLNGYTFTPVLGACSALPNSRRGMQVHALMIKSVSETETVPKTALMDMYSKYGLMEKSVQVFDEMGFKDVVIWNALLSNFIRHGKFKKALEGFEEMRREGVEFSEFTLCSLLKACTYLKALRQGIQIHGLVVVRGRDLVVLSTTLIEFYSNIGLIGEAIKIFENLSSGRDNVICNSFIAACVRNRRHNEALSIMSTMRPNVVSLTSAITACAGNSDLWTGKQIHCVATRFGLVNDTQLCNVLLDMYAKCGKISAACLLFDRIPQKDVVSWTSMIDAYGSHGFGFESVELFKRMEAVGNIILPNEVTLLAVLSACSHSGLVDEGSRCFHLLRAKYGFTPGPEHYACYIDILGRAGHIEEVWSLYHEMVKSGTKPSGAVWAALLNACAHSNDVSRGNFAAKQLFALDSDKPGIIVLISNFYAAIGKWQVVDQLRSTMKRKGLVKDIGSSCVTL
ncbi:hypothetical protein Nepgr_016717 [Nepenthes gracilis]|uniref:Pentatricopeptide repeat-containing protein n=1 Tax=Nepenthes gracilis TaxID=150966 RepID=A0AAD3SQT2_NEPGR|nr:hypothetical protein Nepgr_016717 [Nepenthes gracilis]